MFSVSNLHEDDLIAHDPEVVQLIDSSNLMLPLSVDGILISSRTYVYVCIHVCICMYTHVYVCTCVHARWCNSSTFST